MTNQSDLVERIEPTGDIDFSAVHPEVAFLRKPAQAQAEPWLKGLAVGSFGLLDGFNVWVANGAGRPLAEIVGVAFGTLILPLLAVWIAGFSASRQTQRARYKVFAITVLVLMSIQVLGLAASRGYFHKLPGMKARTPEQLLLQAQECQKRRDLACAEDAFAEYLAGEPDDGYALARLAMVKNWRGDHAGAVSQFAKAVTAGVGSYDMFAAYADSLTKLGRIDEAIEWHYRALAVLPTLVNVRAELARLLVSKGRQFEALSLLQAFDYQAEQRGQPPKFVAQRIAIEGALGSEGGQAPASAPLRLPVYGGHYFAPVAVGNSRPAAFMVDTGASLTSMSAEFLRTSGARYRVIEPDARMTTADGRRISTQIVLIESMRVGPYELRNVLASHCADCVPLLGQSALGRFDMQSQRSQGVEFLSLLLRPGEDRKFDGVEAMARTRKAR